MSTCYDHSIKTLFPPLIFASGLAILAQHQPPLASNLLGKFDSCIVRYQLIVAIPGHERRKVLPDDGVVPERRVFSVLCYG